MTDSCALADYVTSKCCERYRFMTCRCICVNGIKKPEKEEGDE